MPATAAPPTRNTMVPAAESRKNAGAVSLNPAWSNQTPIECPSLDSQTGTGLPQFVLTRFPDANRYPLRWKNALT